MTQPSMIPSPSDEQDREWVLAIDGGGTKTAVAVYLARACLPTCFSELQQAGASTTIPSSGSCHPTSWDQSQVNLARAIQWGIDQIRARSGRLTNLVMALAGAGREPDRLRVERWLAESGLITRTIVSRVVGDIEPILEFSSRQDNDAKQNPSRTMAAIMGTGSIVVGRKEDGVLVRAGGWGPTLGDEGSGWAIARDALIHMCKFIDDGMDWSKASRMVQRSVEVLLPTQDTNKLSEVSRDRLASAILELANQRSETAKLALAVARLAASNECAVSTAIVTHQIGLFSKQIQTVYRRLQWNDGPWKLNVTGGLVVQQDFVQDLLLGALERSGHRPASIHEVDPLVAAIQMAWRLAQRAT